MKAHCDICGAELPPDTERSVLFIVPGSGMQRIVICESMACNDAALKAAG